MDPARLTLTFAILVLGIGLGRFVLSLGRAGDVMAALFVPPDRTLGWPHGVQESDEPWGWHEPMNAAPAPAGGGESDDDGDGDWEASELRELGGPTSGILVVPVERVAPVHVGVRPH
jgi:hypothetical protein